MVRVNEKDRTQDATCLERADHAGAHLDGRVTRLADSKPACDCNDAIVVDVDDLFELHREFIEVLGPDAHEPHEPVASHSVLCTCHSHAPLAPALHSRFEATIPSRTDLSNAAPGSPRRTPS